MNDDERTRLALKIEAAVAIQVELAAKMKEMRQLMNDFHAVMDEMSVQLRAVQEQHKEG